MVSSSDCKIILSSLTFCKYPFIELLSKTSSTSFNPLKFTTTESKDKIENVKLRDNNL